MEKLLVEEYIIKLLLIAILGQENKWRFNTLFLYLWFWSGCVSQLLLQGQSEAESFCHELNGLSGPCNFLLPPLFIASLLYSVVTPNGPTRHWWCIRHGLVMNYVSKWPACCFISNRDSMQFPRAFSILLGGKERQQKQELTFDSPFPIS